MGKLINDTIQIFNKVVKGALITIGNTCTIIGDSNNQAKEFIKPTGEYIENLDDVGSSAFLEIPNGGTIKYAVLEWHSSISNAELNSRVNNHYNSIKFTTPNGIHELKVDINSSNQAEYAESLSDVQSVKWVDVTNILRESYNGYYTVEKIPIPFFNNLKSHNLRAGWSLSVVYENLSMPNRSISISIGIKRQSFKIPRKNRMLEINGFKVPKIPRKSYITIVASNGSPNFYTSLNIYDNKSVTNNMTLEYSVGNFVECRFYNPNSIPIVPHDNVFSGIIMNTDTESSDYGKLNTNGTLGNKNNEAFNTLNQPLYRGNRAKLDILSFDISEKMNPGQENLFLISEIWNPNKMLAIDIILYALQIDTDEPIIDKLKHNENNNLRNTPDIFNNDTCEFKEKNETIENLENDINFNLNYEENDMYTNIIEPIIDGESINKLENTFEEDIYNLSYEQNNIEDNIVEPIEDIFDEYKKEKIKDFNNAFDENKVKIVEDFKDVFEDVNNSINLNYEENSIKGNTVESIEDILEKQEENEIEDIFEEFNNFNSKCEENNLEDKIDIIDNLFNEQEIEDTFDDFDNNLIKSNENIFDKQETNTIEEIVDNFQDFNNSNSNQNSLGNINNNTKSFKEKNDAIKEVSDISENTKGGIFDMNNTSFENAFEKDEKDEFEEIEDIFEKSKNEFNTINADNFKSEFKTNKNLNKFSINESFNDYEFKPFIESNDITLIKTTDKDSYHIDDEITYTIQISNNSSVNVQNIILIDNIPIHSSLVENSLIVNGVNMTVNTLPINGIKIGTLAPSGSAIVLYKVKFYDIPFELPVKVNPKINFIFPMNGEPTPHSLTGTCTTIMVYKDPLGVIQLFANKTIAISGDTILYSLIIKNNGGKLATNVKIMDNLPNGLSFIPDTLIINGISTLGNLNSGVIIPDISPNSQILVTFEVKIN